MEQVKNIVTDILKESGVSFTELSEGTLLGQACIVIKTNESKILIGPKGDAVRALDYLVKRIVEQKKLDPPPFLIDVNDYRTRQVEELENKARIMAERARSFEYDVELTPMSAYERLVIHTTLAEAPQIKTESIGEGRERRVVIKYVSQ